MTPMQPPDREAATLVLLRHAKSDWSGGESDLARPLADRGRRQAREAGRWVRAYLDRVDLVLVSPAERARSTWHLVAAELDPVPTSRVDDRLYAASGEDLVAVVRELPDRARGAVLVAHNPGLEDLVARLTGVSVAMTTSAIAVIALPRPWTTAGQGSATLLSSGRPPTG